MQCPVCNTAVWIGQRYCATCDNYLPQPEEEDHLCPQCHIRVAAQQKTCHRCKITLPETAAGLLVSQKRTWTPSSTGVSIFIGTGLIIAALLLAFFFKKGPGPFS